MLLARVDIDTPAKIKEIALKLGCVYGDDGSTGKLLDAVARGEIILIRAIDPKR
ncbi:hypothetical protein ACE1CI_09875 [Aerosakkonemataceae cyanobacterium BLCC-F50]|uniref:Uncharacterized protein n=1 Tax=Floridaenema flaviceps BLCC-F50 TaxID=3153642 RepID=A0ABV4XPM3_9CYAN